MSKCSENKLFIPFLYLLPTHFIIHSGMLTYLSIYCIFKSEKYHVKVNLKIFNKMIPLTRQGSELTCIFFLLTMSQLIHSLHSP